MCGGLCRRLGLSKVFCTFVAPIQWISFLLPLYPGMKSPRPWAIYPRNFISIIYSYILIRLMPPPHPPQREAFYFENPFCTFENENIVFMFPFTSCGPLEKKSFVVQHWMCMNHSPNLVFVLSEVLSETHCNFFSF